MRNKRILSRLTKSAAFSLVASAATIVALDVARRLYRNSQLFCPIEEPTASWDPSDYGVPDGAAEEHWFETADGEMLYGWYCRAKKPVASALFCHGNTGNLTTVAEMIPHLLDSGINVLYFDYRGFGRSTGSPSIGGVIADAVTAARFHEKLRPAGLPSILYGFSLGGAIAAQVARHHHFDGLILQSTFTSLQQIARVAYPRVPLHLLSGNFFDTMSVVEKLDIPLLIMHGTDDEVIPCWMAHRLFDACRHDRKQIQIVEEGLHKDLFVVDADSLVQAVNRFASELTPGLASTFTPEEPGEAEAWSDAAWRGVRRLMRRRQHHRSAAVAVR